MPLNITESVSCSCREGLQLAVLMHGVHTLLANNKLSEGHCAFEKTEKPYEIK